MWGPELAVDGTSGASELTSAFDLEKTPDNEINRLSSFYVEGYLLNLKSNAKLNQESVWK